MPPTKRPRKGQPQDEAAPQYSAAYYKHVACGQHWREAERGIVVGVAAVPGLGAHMRLTAKPLLAHIKTNRPNMLLVTKVDVPSARDVPAWVAGQQHKFDVLVGLGHGQSRLTCDIVKLISARVR